MRVVAALIGLIFAATVVVAQDAVEPTPYPVYPLCDMAFANAAEAAVAAGEAPLEPVVSPDPSAVPSDIPGDAPSPQPVVVSPILDEAIRSCSGIEEFAAAAALHPAALGDTEPLAFLLVRCADPSTGLERYATCASLERALATPEPTPEPTASPKPIPKATAVPRVRSPSPRTKTKPRVTPPPAVRATPRPTPRPTPKSDWTRAAARTLNRYVDSAHRAYVRETYRPMHRLRYTDCPRDMDCALLRQMSAGIVRNAKTSIKRHLSFMRANPPAKCFRDAYTADRSIASALLQNLSNWRGSPSGTLRYWNQRIAIIHSAGVKHVANVSKYTRDCR